MSALAIRAAALAPRAAETRRATAEPGPFRAHLARTRGKVAKVDKTAPVAPDPRPERRAESNGVRPHYDPGAPSGLETASGEANESNGVRPHCDPGAPSGLETASGEHTGVGPPSGTPSGPAALAALTATAAGPPADALPALTPLEQAVHDLIDQMGSLDAGGPAAADDDIEPADDVPRAAFGLDPATLLAPAPSATAAVSARHAAAATVAPLREVPEQGAAAQTAQSHVHLVLGEGDARVVMTVAVRGHEVHVTTRGADDATAASLARNASSLDHAMRARGLDLAELSQQSAPDRDRGRPTRDRRGDADAAASSASPDGERFSLATHAPLHPETPGSP